MSLALAAKHLAARGRGNDSMLVHMSPKEVSALQGVALAHGGSLSVNPDTGLPEASFLESVLPTVLGAGLMMIPGLNIGALGAAGLIGGLQYARTGDVNKGLMAGLGAYGGAGIAEGLASAGSAATEAATKATTEQVAADQAAKDAAAQAAMKAEGLSIPQAVGPQGFVNTAAPKAAASTVSVPPATPLQNMSAGLGEIKSADAFGSFVGANKYPLMASGLSIASKEGAFDAPKPPEDDPSYIRPYEFSAGYTSGQAPAAAPEGGLPYTSERQWFTPTYTPMPVMRAASGGVVALAEGGSSEGRMTGQSKEAYDYLMGRLPARPVAPPPPRPAAPTAPPVSETASAYRPNRGGLGGIADAIRRLTNPQPSGGGFRYDPATQTYTQLPAPEREVRRGSSWMDRFNRHASDRRPIIGRFGFNEGGSTSLEKGGFVVPADVVSALGNGSSSAGLELLADRLGARSIKGPGDGMSDSIRTSIEGKQKAAIARDEAYIPREAVKRAGGAKKLYAMMDNVRSKAHGKKSQQRKLSNPGKLLP